MKHDVRCLVGMSLVALAAMAGAALGDDPPPSEAEAWNVKDPISVSITSPTGNDCYVSINATKQLTATASDDDCYKVDDTWYPYADDVTTGTTDTTYHIKWQVTGQVGSMDPEYGATGTYHAPDYGGTPVRTVTVTCTADDFNRAPDANGQNDTLGADDDAVTATVQLKVWEVTVVHDLTGDSTYHISHDPPGDYAGTVPGAAYGGYTLGWLAWNTPAGTLLYGANVEYIGTVPAELATIPIVTGWNWVHQRKNWARYHTASQGAGVYTYLYNLADWTVFGGESGFQDVDSSNNNKLFWKQTYGFGVGTGNNANIGTPNWWLIYEHNTYYRAYVEYGGVRVSNICPETGWQLQFALQVSGGTQWAVNGGHTP